MAETTMSAKLLTLALVGLVLCASGSFGGWFFVAKIKASLALYQRVSPF